MLEVGDFLGLAVGLLLVTCELVLGLALALLLTAFAATRRFERLPARQEGRGARPAPLAPADVQNSDYGGRRTGGRGRVRPSYC